MKHLIWAAAAALAAPAAARAEDIHLVLREQHYHETVLTGTPTTLGAIRVGMGEIYDETATTRIGSILMTCANTEVQDGKVLSAYCSGVIKTTKGVISFSAASSADDIIDHVHKTIITGGTGDYEGVRGHGFNRFASQPSYQDLYLKR